MLLNSRPFLGQRVLRLFLSKSSPPVRCYSAKPFDENEANNKSVSSDSPNQFDEPVVASKAQQTYKANLSATKLLTNHQPHRARRRKTDSDEMNLFEDYNRLTVDSIASRPTNNQESQNIFNPAFSVVPRPSFKKKLKPADFKRYSEAEKRALENLNLDKYEEIYRENLRDESQRKDKVLSKNVEDRTFFEAYLESREFEEHTVEMFEQLVKCDEDRERIKQILREYELEKYNTSQVPTKITLAAMESLLKCSTESELVKALNGLFKKESKKIVQKSRHEFEKKIIRENMIEKFGRHSKRTGLQFEDGKPVYAKWKNTLFIAFNRELLRKANDRLLRDASLFGPRLVIDFGFDEQALKPSIFTTLKNQLFYTLGELHRARIPFHLTLANLEKGSEFDTFLRKEMPNLYLKHSLINVTERPCTQLFPKNNLVYLTPDANRYLTRVDPDKVHVIAGICEKSSCKKFILTKAQTEGIPAYKLPLEHYFFFKLERSLTINATVGILCNYLDKQDWRQSLIGKVPSRKLKTPDEIRIEQYRKVKKYFSKEKFFKAQQFSQSEANSSNNRREADDLYDKIFPTAPSPKFPIYGEQYNKQGALRDYMIDDEGDKL